jgi:hypothetical protein
MGRDVFWVLLISTALAALALFAAWMWRANQLASTEPNNGRQPADARSFSAPEPAPVAQPPQGAAADR